MIGAAALRAASGAAARAVLAGVALACAFPAAAHKSSDSYLQLDVSDNGLAVRWDIALRDLDAALDLDADADGKLTWGEVRSAWPRIESYALPRLDVEGCVLRPGGRSLERRNDGAYAVLQLTSSCQPHGAPAIGYSLFREVDPTHRGIAKVQRPGQSPALSVLDPTRSSPTAPLTAGSAARTGASAAAGVAGVPSPASSPWNFTLEGVRHILGGYDHVLFLLCLLLPSVMQRTGGGWRPVRRLRDAVLPVVGIVTAFTVAHSITLALAAVKWVSLSPGFIEPAIALTIILAALDNLWPVFPVPRIVVTFLFGLVHGFGFAGVLGELDLPTADFAWALLQFNVGLELGQLLIVVAATAALYLLRGWRYYGRWVIGGGSCVAIALGLVWLVERTAGLTLPW